MCYFGFLGGFINEREQWCAMLIDDGKRVAMGLPPMSMTSPTLDLISVSPKIKAAFVISIEIGPAYRCTFRRLRTRRRRQRRQPAARLRWLRGICERAALSGRAAAYPRQGFSAPAP
jgi:hypothetical protein